MAPVIALTDLERAYLRDQPLGRLATVDASGAPQNSPVGVFLDEESGDIVIGGHASGATRKFRNVQSNPRVAVVVDDLVSTDPWTVRGLEVRGTALALSDVDPPVPLMSGRSSGSRRRGSPPGAWTPTLRTKRSGGGAESRALN